MKDITNVVQSETAVEAADRKEISVQTDLTLADLKALEEDYQRRMSENLRLKERLQSAGSAFPDRETLRNDDRLLNSYTGMPCYQVLDTLFKFIASVITITTSTKLTAISHATNETQNEPTPL